MDLANETFGQFFTPEMQADEGLKDYGTMKGIDLINAHKELAGQVKTAKETQTQFETRLSKAVEPLPENATPEQQKEHQAKVRGLVGVPEKPTDYKVQVPEGVSASDPLLMAFVTKAHEAGMSAAQVQAGVNTFVEYAAKAEADAVKATETALKTTWGPNYEKNCKRTVATLNLVFKEAGVPAAEVAALAPVLNRNAAFAQAMLKISRFYKEAELEGTGSGNEENPTASPMDRLAARIAARSKQGA
jgi:hypothetical protein